MSKIILSYVHTRNRMSKYLLSYVHTTNFKAIPLLPSRKYHNQYGCISNQVVLSYNTERYKPLNQTSEKQHSFFNFSHTWTYDTKWTYDSSTLSRRREGAGMRGARRTLKVTTRTTTQRFSTDNFPFHLMGQEILAVNITRQLRCYVKIIILSEMTDSDVKARN